MVTPAEFTWREWVLGEGRFAGRGPRSSPRPDVGYGDPSKSQKPVPEDWWYRLEMFLAHRSDYAESGQKGPEVPSKGDAATAQLTAHFNVREFDCHDGRKVPAVALPALERLCKDILEPLRDQFGAAHVLSGYRPVDYNRAIGGARYSQHIYEITPNAVAADLTFKMGGPATWAQAADRLGAGGVGRYDHSGFVHVDNRPGRARWTG